jgi:hypothetical protein
MIQNIHVSSQTSDESLLTINRCIKSSPTTSVFYAIPAATIFNNLEGENPNTRMKFACSVSSRVSEMKISDLISRNRRYAEHLLPKVEKLIIDSDDSSGLVSQYANPKEVVFHKYLNLDYRNMNQVGSIDINCQEWMRILLEIPLHIDQTFIRKYSEFSMKEIQDVTRGDWDLTIHSMLNYVKLESIQATL